MLLPLPILTGGARALQGPNDPFWMITDSERDPEGGHAPRPATLDVAHGVYTVHHVTPGARHVTPGAYHVTQHPVLGARR